MKNRLNDESMAEYNYTPDELDKILSKAKMSPKLREAIESIKEAIEKNDDELVADLSVVKSFIISVIDPSDKSSHFQEEEKYNRKVLGTSLYEYLDGLNYKYANITGTLPSGMIVYTYKGKQERGASKRKHPIIKLIEKEHNELIKNVGK